MLRFSGIQNNNIETNDKKNIRLFKIKVIFPVSFSFFNDIYLTVWQSTTFIYNEQFCRVRQRYFANDHKISALAKLILGLIGRRSLPILYKGKFSVLSYKLVGGDQNMGGHRFMFSLFTVFSIFLLLLTRSVDMHVTQAAQWKSCRWSVPLCLFN